MSWQEDGNGGVFLPVGIYFVLSAHPSREPGKRAYWRITQCLGGGPTVFRSGRCDDVEHGKSCAIDALQGFFRLGVRDLCRATTGNDHCYERGGLDAEDLK